YDFDTAQRMEIPGDWNTQDEQLFFYEGSVWFQRYFSFDKSAQTGRTFLYFGAVNYLCNVYLNGREIGTHEGGFTPFWFDVTDKLRDGENFVVLRVNNRREPHYVPTVNADWWNYGGITRDVLLVNTPQTYIADYTVRLAAGCYDRVEVSASLSEAVAGREITISIPELSLSKTLKTDAEGRISTTLSVKPELWSPENPKLYDVTFTSAGEEVADRIGFRHITTEGKKLLLNGEEVFLRGISIHEEAPYRQGRAFGDEDAATLLGWAKELGCNFVRLAHYPHNEKMVRKAEEMGFMVWSEIPVYWTIHWENATTYANAEKQLTDMIARDKNRAAIIIWSVANETPHSDARELFLSRLATKTRELDPSRLVSMAMEVTGTSRNVSRVEDPMSKYVDIISFNQYLGWYGGTPADCLTRTYDIPYDKPVFISEWGGGALYGYHGDDATRFTEEYQNLIYKNTAVMLDKIDGLVGCSPWILMDFRSPRRQLPHIQDFFNRKGIISERGQRKMAFYTLQEYYSRKAAEQAK
ncbi:MAG: beta-glucuronidase, partial [Tidjanibacter sp.]|nr:beta-glucuronidase [Tidjanibacter sp.]